MPLPRTSVGPTPIAKTSPTCPIGTLISSAANMSSRSTNTIRKEKEPGAACRYLRNSIGNASTTMPVLSRSPIMPVPRSFGSPPKARSRPTRPRAALCCACKVLVATSVRRDNGSTRWTSPSCVPASIMPMAFRPSWRSTTAACSCWSASSPCRPTTWARKPAPKSIASLPPTCLR